MRQWRKLWIKCSLICEKSQHWIETVWFDDKDLVSSVCYTCMIPRQTQRKTPSFSVGVQLDAWAVFLQNHFANFTGNQLNLLLIKTMFFIRFTKPVDFTTGCLKFLSVVQLRWRWQLIRVAECKLFPIQIWMTEITILWSCRHNYSGAVADTVPVSWLQPFAI